MTDNRLYRSESDRILGGVCGGLAEIYDIDPTLVRLLTVLFVLATGVGPLIYVVAWLIMPSESEVKGDTREVQEVELSDEGSEGSDDGNEDEEGSEESEDDGKDE